MTLTFILLACWAVYGIWLIVRKPPLPLSRRKEAELEHEELSEEFISFLRNEGELNHPKDCTYCSHRRATGRKVRPERGAGEEIVLKDADSCWVWMRITPRHPDYAAYEDLIENHPDRVVEYFEPEVKRLRKKP